jgi:hypothetical protein
MSRKHSPCSSNAFKVHIVDEQYRVAQHVPGNQDAITGCRPPPHPLRVASDRAKP